VPFRKLTLLALVAALPNCGGESKDFFADGPSAGTAGTGTGGTGMGQAGASTGGTSSAGNGQGGAGSPGSGGGTAARGGAGSSAGGTTSGGTTAAGGSESGGTENGGNGAAGGSAAGGSAGDGGSGGAATAGIGGETGGTGGGASGSGGRGPTCAMLTTQYAEALEEAKACSANADEEQCTESVPDELACPCPVLVNPDNEEAMNRITRILQQAERSCEPQPCPAIACAPAGGFCSSRGSGSGTCVTSSDR